MSEKGSKQKEILEFIKQFILDKGYPPTVRDIGIGVNLKSTASVHFHLQQLEKSGQIRRDPAKPRTIEIVDDEFNLQGRELVNVPMIGTVTAGQPILAVENINGYFPVPVEYHSVMIEVNKRLYMDEKTLEKTDGFLKLKEALCSLYKLLLIF